MPRARFALPAALFSALALFFSLFTWGEEQILENSRFVFGFTPPAFSGDTLLFLADLFLVFSPFAVLFFSLASLFEPRVKKALFLPALFPAIYASLRFFAFLFAGTLPEMTNRVPVWIFLLLLFVCSFFVPKRPSFALLPLLFFLTETVLFCLSLIFEKNLFELSKGLGDDLYILPSSIHEVIAVPSSLGDPEELASMVQEVNMSVVDVSERLSNQVYHYNRDSRKLSMATDTPSKDIVNAVAEISLVYDTEPKR